uniref:Cytochrome c oxidase subunit 3 n=1 Tax=Moniliformis sp. TaxID=3068474 RepID=A0AA96V4P8_9BILA|nr:cytochrome c oxidase subunit 3 [Moniliformis sp.]
MFGVSPFLDISGSVWPVFISCGLMNFIVVVFNFGLGWFSMISILVLFGLVLGWALDLGFESKILGSSCIMGSMFVVVGVLMVIGSEVMLFFGVFWYLVQVSAEGSVFLGFHWVSPCGSHMDIMEVPLLISVVLMSSGVSVTLAHSSIQVGKLVSFYVSFLATIALGIIFVYIQYCEYSVSMFTLGDGVVSSVFYMLTGMHGSHVLVGVAINLIVLVMTVASLVPFSFLGVEVAMWYWHFVDVVWLILFVVLYWFSM